MGDYIESYCEVKKDGQWTKVGKLFTNTDFNDGRKVEHPFYWQNYNRFGFLADVRNYRGDCIPLSKPRGLPDDVCDGILWRWMGKQTPYTFSWSFFTLKELLDFDYKKTLIEYNDDGSGEDDGECGKGTRVTYREYLGKGWFDSLNELKQLGTPENVRVVFWFN